MDVDRMQAKLATWSQDPGFEFDDIFNLLYDEDFLSRAYQSVRSNRGARTAGVDGQTAEDFGEDRRRNLKDLRKALKSRSFTPTEVRRTYIPKGDGRKRPLGIPTIRDRVVQEALRMVLEPIYETDFSDSSFGFRPNRSAHDAIMSVRTRMSPATNYYMPWVIDADVAGFFDNVHHPTLMEILQDRITDRKLLDLIWKFLRAGIMENGMVRRSMFGTPQGGIVSPLLANIYLNELDQWAARWTSLSPKERARRWRNGKGNWHYVRYADDFLFMTNGTKGRAEHRMEEIELFIEEELNLALSEKKTRLAHAEDGLSFLGYDLKADVDTGGTKRTVPKDAVRDVRSRIREATSGPTDVSARAKIQAISSVLRGWVEYYKYATDATSVFDHVEQVAWQEVTGWLARKYDCTKKRLISRKLDDHSPISVNGATLYDPTGKSEVYGKSPTRHDHPYLGGENAGRERLSEGDQWLANAEDRKGWQDKRVMVAERDDHACQKCGKDLSNCSYHVHHHRMRSRYGDPERADRPNNMETLCGPCHREKESKLAR